MPNYSKVLKNARICKESVETKQELGVSKNWGYYFAKEVLNPKKSIKQISIKPADKKNSSYISRQIYRSSYFDLAERLVKSVEKNGKLPANLKFTTKTGKVYYISLNDLIYMFARIILYFDVNGKMPSYANVNSKIWIKETEPADKVMSLWVKYFNFKPVCIDDVCEYIMKHFTYEFYFDDRKSNEEVIKSRAGNCTDLLQLLVNMGVALGYDWKVIHTQCKQSGTGHVYGKFKKSGDWFVRDVACIADESQFCVWCDVDNGGGYLLATNPSWFISNLNR